MEKEYKGTYIPGVKEWFGNDALIFWNIRNSIESKLFSLGFNFYYGGLVSKKNLYENSVESLGDSFLNNLVNFQLQKDKDSNLIIAPEATIRVYDFLERQKDIKDSDKIFYSQEFMRNENQKDINSGKTFSFWQTGYEIYGNNKKECSLSAIETTSICLDILKIEDLYLRISDKRILEGMLLSYSLNERRQIYNLIDLCDEKSNLFYTNFIKNGGEKEIANKIADLLSLSDKNYLLTFNDLRDCTKNEYSINGINELEDLIKNITHKINHKIKLIPFMPKSWDACDSLLFDARIDNYKYALAGGGNLSTTLKKGLYKSGAGIGVTRLTEYIIKSRNKDAN